jgi:hypothetical protein
VPELVILTGAGHFFRVYDMSVLVVVAFYDISADIVRLDDV